MGVKQTIPNSTNSPKSISFSKLRGMDCSSSPFEVALSRATDMKNLINQDGVNHKRHGWSENTELYQKLGEYNKNITGLYKLNETKFVIFNDVSGCIFDIENQIKIQDIEINLPESEKIKLVKLVKLNDVKILIVISFTNSKDKIIFLNTAGDEYSFTYDLNYIPTTTISINPDKDTTATRESFEEPSLTTQWRKNKLISYYDKPCKLTFKYVGNNENLYIYFIYFNIGKSHLGKTYEDGVKESTACFRPGKYSINGFSLKNKSTQEVIQFIWENGYVLEDEEGKAFEPEKDFYLDKDVTVYIKEAGS